MLTSENKLIGIHAFKFIPVYYGLSFPNYLYYHLLFTII